MSPHEIAEEASSALGQKIKPTFGYYRQPNKWITVSPVTRLERVAYIEQGWEHLGAYGAFDMTPYVANHPLEGLFMFGGAKELPVDQIQQMGFHITPPMVPVCKQHITQFHRSHSAACWRGAKPVEFPQLAGMTLEKYPCEFCERTLPTAPARKQHQQVAHKEELSNIQSGRSLADAIATAKPVEAQPDVNALLERIARLEKQLANPQQDNPPTPPPPSRVTHCDCGGAYSGARGKNFHEKTKRHQKWAARQSEPEPLSAPR